jgi:hypothetical protein
MFTKRKTTIPANWSPINGDNGIHSPAFHEISSLRSISHLSNLGLHAIIDEPGSLTMVRRYLSTDLRLFIQSKEFD